MLRPGVKRGRTILKQGGERGEKMIGAAWPNWRRNSSINNSHDTVGRQKSQTTAFDANHWKAILQNIRLVWSQVVGSRIVGWRVVGSWIVCRPLASRTIASLPVVSRPIASRPLTSLPPASSWSQVVGSWGRWVPKRCPPPFGGANA